MKKVFIIYEPDQDDEGYWWNKIHSIWSDVEKARPILANLTVEHKNYWTQYLHGTKYASPYIQEMLLDTVVHSIG